MASISAGASGAGRKALNPSIPLVPFLDLLLCCVMFLLVTAVWNELGQLSVNQAVPGAGADMSPAPPELKRFLRVRAEGYELGSNLGDRQWIPRGPEHLLREALVAQRGLDVSERGALSVGAEDGVSFEALVGAMDCALGAGFVTLDVDGR